MKIYLVTEDELNIVRDYNSGVADATIKELKELPSNARVLTPEDIAAGLDRCGLGNTREETAEYLNEELFDRGTRAQDKMLTREQVYNILRNHAQFGKQAKLVCDDLFGESE